MIPSSWPPATVRLEMLDAEREKVLEVRSTGRMAHEVIEDVLAADLSGAVGEARKRGLIV